MSDKPDRPGKRAVKVPAPRQRLDLWHGVFFVLGVVLTAGAVMLMAGHGLGFHRPGPATGSTLPKATGPWGVLEYTTIELERPDESLQVKEGVKVPPPRWIFENITESNLVKLLTGSNVPADQGRELTNRSYWTRVGNGWQVLPPPDAVVALSPQARLHIYAVLRRSPQNPLYFHPFHIAAAKFEHWLKTSEMAEDKQDLMRRLAYTEGDTTYLSDFEVIEGRCSLEERKRFAKNISRNQALIMRLRVTPDSDVDALARYWGRGGRMKAMKPLLESLAHVQGGAVIAVSYFFPEFARMRVHTYPDPQTDATALRQDCFWTAMNFLNEEPDNRFLQPDAIRQTLQSDYVQIQTNWAYGDIIVLLENGRDATHMCVYIADNVVFTKNGVDPLEPWLLMKIPDMIPRYENGKPISLLGYRKKSR